MSNIIQRHGSHSRPCQRKPTAVSAAPSEHERGAQLLWTHISPRQQVLLPYVQLKARHVSRYECRMYAAAALFTVCAVPPYLQRQLHFRRPYAEGITARIQRVRGDTNHSVHDHTRGRGTEEARLSPSPVLARTSRWDKPRAFQDETHESWAPSVDVTSYRTRGAVRRSRLCANVDSGRSIRRRISLPDRLPNSAFCAFS